MGRNHDFPARMLCLAKRKEIIEEPLCAKFQKLSGTEEITDKKGGVSRFSVEIFLCNGAEKFQRGILLCITKSLVSKKNYTDESGEKEGVSRCPIENFCPTVLEFFVGEHLGASLFSRTKK